jgi:hypothetical protein
MEDLMIPESAYSTSTVLTPTSSALQPGPEVEGAGSHFANFRFGNTSLPTLQPVTSSSGERYRTTPQMNQIPSAAQPRLTLLVLRGGRMCLVTDYWVNNGNLVYSTGGSLHAMPLDALDMPLTRQLNAERSGPFTLTAKHH